MKRLDLSSLPELQKQMHLEFAQSSITPRDADGKVCIDPQYHDRKYPTREYVQFGDFKELHGRSRTIHTMLAEEKDKLSKCCSSTTLDYLEGTANTQRKQSQKTIECLDSELAKITAFQSAITDSEHANLFIEAYNNGKSNITRYGIDVSSAQAYVIKYNTQLLPAKTQPAKATNPKSPKSEQSNTNDENLTKVLHPIEIILIQEALKSPHRTVLVDVFDRNDDGSIKLSGTAVSTHTVVLHKQALLVLLIDPTNSEYSQHLSLGINKELLGVTLLTPSKKLEIYTPKQDEIGRLGHQTRDCVDIATKIALQLEMPDTPQLVATSEKSSTKTEKPQIKDWQTWQPLIAISNREIAEDIPSSLIAPYEGGKHVVPLRIRQSSDDCIRNKFLLLSSEIQHLFKISKQLKGVKVYNSDIEEKYMDLLSKESNHMPYAELLVNLVSVYDDLNKHATDLLGQQKACLHAHVDP